MDELEFRKRVYENPKDLDQETLDMARANAVYQKILDETVEFESVLGELLNRTELPDDLAAKLMAIPYNEDRLETAESLTTNKSTAAPNVTHMKHIESKKQNLFQYYAIAASLVLALGVTFSLRVNNSPSDADIAFGDDLLSHLYIDNMEINDITNGQSYAVLDLSEINMSIANAGTRLVSHGPSQNFEVRSAKPCKILPTYQSAHLVLDGSQGAVSIILTNNFPVEVEFSIQDDRFNGIVVPMGEGNMILVGEKNEDLDQYKSRFSEQVEWLI